MDDLSGHVVKGYELHEQLGVGGYGAVYRAVQPFVKRGVAIKIILPQYANHPDFIRRFEAEAQLVARLEHPHIVPLYDYWREPDSAYLVMRFLRGGSLHNRLANNSWSVEELFQVLDHIAAALTIAHRHGVIHRDLKPANILLDEDGNAYLADFGIAKDLGNIYQTDHTAVVGAPAYISPEQIKAEPVTPQTDIYSLGVMLYEILTGALPFESPTPIALLFKHLHEPVPSLQERRPDLPQAVNNVIQKAAAKNPADRYPDVLSMVMDLRQAFGSETAQRRRAGTTTPTIVDGRPGDGRRTSSGARTESPYTTGVIYRTALLDAIVPAVENPYKGLRAFQEADAADFFGREALVGHLLARMAEKTDLSRFLAVVGPSGSGKSSVVHAGLIPALRRGALPGSHRWFVVEMTPGTNPLQELETALLRVAINRPANLMEHLRRDDHGLLHAVQRLLPGGAETELVLVIDQFEEIFTLVEDEAARAHLLNSLLVAVTDPRSRLRLVVTLRADFYDRPLLYTGLSELVRQRTEVVVPLAPEELQHAIVGPAQRVGLMLEPDLVAAIIHDVSEQPGALPLLQYALTELFERRQERTLTLEAYHDSGGVLGALARRADEIYIGLNEKEQEAARQLFLRLVTLGEGTEDTRRRVHRAELTSITGDGRALDTVIDTYSKYRLLTLDRDPLTREPTVEVAHEALIRTWNRLREWLNASRDDLRLQRRLAAAAAEWSNVGRERSFLASGARLEQFATWAEETPLGLNQEERAYLVASLVEREAQRAQEERRKAHEVALERRSRNILRALVGVFLVAALIALGLSVLAFSQRQAADIARQEAQRNAEAAQRNAGAAQQAQQVAQHEAQNAQEQKGIAERNADEARNVALFAGAQAAFYQGNLDQALTLAVEANQTQNPRLEAQSILAEAAYAPGTRSVFRGHKNGVMSVAISPDGRTGLSGAKDNTVILWDLSTGKTIRTFEGHTKPVRGVAFNPQGGTALSGAEDGTMILWDLATGTALRTFKGHAQDAEVKGVAFSPDGKSAISTSSDSTLILWDLATGTALRTFNGHTQEVNNVAFSPDGKQALSSSQDTTVKLWDVATGQLIRTFAEHKAEVRGIAWSPDATTAVSSDEEGNIILWDVATAKSIRSFPGHTRSVMWVAFSPDGNTILSGSIDNRLGLWNVKTGAPIRFLNGHGAGVNTAVFSPDGSQVLSGANDNTLRLWDLTSGAQVRRFAGHSDGVNSVAFSPDGQTALSASGDTTLILWDVATGQDIRHFRGHADGVHWAAFSPDGKTAISAAGDVDKTLILWDVTTGTTIRVFKGHTDGVRAVAFSPDGKSVLSGGADDALILWDVATAQQIRRFEGKTEGVQSIAFSPDGSKALTGSTNKAVILWDVATGQQIRTFEGHSGKVFSVVFSRDGSRALSGSADKRMILWDVSNGEPLKTFPLLSSAVQAVAFSPDGKLAVSGIADKTVIVWDIDSGERIRSFVGHTGAVVSVAFSPDGRTVLSGSGDTSLILWRLDSTGDLLSWAEANRHIPPLNCDEQKLYGLDRPCTNSDAASAP